MAETRRDLSDRLSGLLTDLDIAVRVRLREAEKQAGRHLAEPASGSTRIRRVVEAALRWLAHRGGDQPESRRARSAHELRSGR